MKQPRALTPLFMTELWERYGFYVVQGMLIFFMTNALQLTDRKADIISGEYLALVYISPLIGGFIADRIMGFRNSIMLGAILLCLGYAIVATTNRELLFWGLSTIVMGNGFLKPNISSYLGEFYTENDPRRESGFTLFYIGINIGIILATLSAGFIQRSFGWNITFATAALGMVIAIFSFWSGYKCFADKGLPVSIDKIKPKSFAILANPFIMLLFLILSIALVYLLLKFAGVGDILLSIISVVILITLLYLTTRYEKRVRYKMLLLIILISTSVIFWALFWQMFISFSLFIERGVNRNVFGFNIPPVAFLSLESTFILLLGAPFAYLWRRLSEQNKNPSLGMKFSLAFLMITIAMGITVLAINLTSTNVKVNPSWIILIYFFITLGELLLSPIGLAMVTELAPKNLTGLMMGVWFMAIGFGGLLAGTLAKLASIPKDVTDLGVINSIYSHAFLSYMLLALTAGIFLFLITPWLKKLANSF